MWILLFYAQPKSCQTYCQSLVALTDCNSRLLCSDGCAFLLRNFCPILGCYSMLYITLNVHLEDSDPHGFNKSFSLHQ